MSPDADVPTVRAAASGAGSGSTGLNDSVVDIASRCVNYELVGADSESQDGRLLAGRGNQERLDSA